MSLQKFIKYKLLDKNGNLSEHEYDIKLNISENSGNYLIHRDIIRQQIYQKQGTVSTKTRSEVRGGGCKPWRQKGTGKARAGSRRSPLWKGGGVIFGPKPKKINLKLNKKERKLALQTVLYNKRRIIWILENLENLIEKPKTKILNNIFKEYGFDITKKILLIVTEKSLNLKLSTRNLKNVELISVMNLNTLNLLKAKQVILTLPAFNKLKEVYGS